MKGEILDELKEVIENSNNIVFFGGAGVSTESGVPDFRSADGLYRAQSEFGMSPEEMISHTFFMRDTETFFRYYITEIIPEYDRVLWLDADILVRKNIEVRIYLMVKEYSDLFKVGDEFHKKASEDISFQMLSLFLYILFII